MAAVVWLFGTTNLWAEVAYEERTETFEVLVSGKAPADIWKGIRNQRPFSFDETTVGNIQSKFGWSQTSERSARGCRLKSVEVRASMIITLPAWSGRDFAPPAQQSTWDCIERTVTTHEKTHARIWLETAHNIDRGMREISGWMPCAELEQKLTQTFNSIHDQGKQRQAAFDAEEQRNPRYQRCIPSRPAPTTIAVKPPVAEPASPPPPPRAPLVATQQPVTTSATPTSAAPTGKTHSHNDGGLVDALSSFFWLLVLVGALIATYVAVMAALTIAGARTKRSEVGDTKGTVVTSVQDTPAGPAKQASGRMAGQLTPSVRTGFGRRKP